MTDFDFFVVRCFQQLCDVLPKQPLSVSNCDKYFLRVQLALELLKIVTAVIFRYNYIPASLMKVSYLIA